MSKQTFKTALLKGEGDTTGFVIPDKVVEALGQGKRPKVTVTINGKFSYPNTVAVMGGQYMIGISKERRKLAGVTGGEMIDVTLELDTAPRVMEVPPDLADGARQRQDGEVVFRDAELLEPAPPHRSDQRRKVTGNTCATHREINRAVP